MGVADRSPHALKDDDQHRLQCPRGHSHWKPIDGHFWCRYCEENWDGVEGTFDEVFDAKTGETLDRVGVRELKDAIRRQQAAEG